MINSRQIRSWTILLVTITVVFLSGCDLRYGFVESEFQLANESRLPKWFVMPPNYTRKDLTMTVTYYTFDKTKIVIRGPAPDYKVLMEKVGTDRWHPLTKQRGYEYPHYVIVSVDNIEEIFEHKKMEPVVYITDDPKVTSVLKQQAPSR